MEQTLKILRKTFRLLIVLSTIAILDNYSTYCKNISSDTIQVIRYNGNFGLFVDSVAANKLTRKVLLADSLTKVNIINEDIIKRFGLGRKNCIDIENNFRQYIVNTDKEKELQSKVFKKQLFKKNLEIWTYRVAILATIIKFVIK